MNSPSSFLIKALFLGPIITIVLTHPLRSESAKDPGEFSIPRRVPLYPQQRARLQNLVTENDEAAVLFQERKAMATPLLNQKPTPLKVIHYEGLRKEFPPSDQAKIDSWLEEIGEHHLKAVQSSTRWTNRYTKSVRMLAIIGRILDREDWVTLAVDGLKTYVTKSLRPDGTSYDLEHRDSLTYHSSGLRSVVGLAIILEDEKTNLYTWRSPNGSSIKKSVDYLVPYANGSKQHREWVHTKVGLDRKRAAAGLEKYRTGRL